MQTNSNTESLDRTNIRVMAGSRVILLESMATWPFFFVSSLVLVPINGTREHVAAVNTGIINNI